MKRQLHPCRLVLCFLSRVVQHGCVRACARVFVVYSVHTSPPRAALTSGDGRCGVVGAEGAEACALAGGATAGRVSGTSRQIERERLYLANCTPFSFLSLFQCRRAQLFFFFWRKPGAPSARQGQYQDGATSHRRPPPDAEGCSHASPSTPGGGCAGFQGRAFTPRRRRKPRLVNRFKPSTTRCLTVTVHKTTSASITSGLKEPKASSP